MSRFRPFLAGFLDTLQEFVREALDGGLRGVSYTPVPVPGREDSVEVHLDLNGWTLVLHMGNAAIEPSRDVVFLATRVFIFDAADEQRRPSMDIVCQEGQQQKYHYQLRVWTRKREWATRKSGLLTPEEGKAAASWLVEFFYDMRTCWAQTPSLAQLREGHTSEDRWGR